MAETIHPSGIEEVSEQDREYQRLIRTLWRCVRYGAVGLNLLVFVAAFVFSRHGWGLALLFWPVLAVIGGCIGLFVGGWVAAIHGCWLRRHERIDWREEAREELPS